MSIIVTCVVCHWQSANVISSANIPAIHSLHFTHSPIFYPSSRSPLCSTHIFILTFHFLSHSNPLSANLPSIFFPPSSFISHSFLLSQPLPPSLTAAVLWVWERKRGRGWAWGKVAEEGGEEGEAHSCGRLIESQQFGQWSPDVWEWSGICNTWLCLWNRACLCQAPCLWPWRVTYCVFFVCVNEWARLFPFCLSVSCCCYSPLLSSCFSLLYQPLSLCLSYQLLYRAQSAVASCLFTKKTTSESAKKKVL